MDVQRLLEARKMVEERIAQLQRELNLYMALLEALDKAIGERSFTTAAEVSKPESVEEVRGKTGEVYATVEIYPDHLHIKFKEPVKVEGLFKRFFLDKFLARYKEEDLREARQGAIKEGEVLRYELEESGGEAAAMKIYHYRTDERKREILRVLRWTLEKVYSG